jgi:hypothetical protein
MRSIAELFGRQKVGTVKSFDLDRGFGFIMLSSSCSKLFSIEECV